MFQPIANLLERNKERIQFKQKVKDLIEECDWNFRFAFLTVMAAIMATLGLMMNNITILIGAMVVAPLLLPVIGLSVGVGAGSLRLILHSLRSLTLGMILAVGMSALLTWLMPGAEIPQELYKNFSNSNLYALVAFASGIVAMYSWFKPNAEHVASGIAIAVALVPPLAFTGMVLVLQPQSGLIDVLTLVLVNLAGIFLGGLLTFITIAIAAKNPSVELGQHVENEAQKHD